MNKFMKNMVAIGLAASSLIFLISPTANADGVTAAKNFANTWKTKLLGINQYQALGVFAINKKYNKPQDIFLINHMVKYTNQSPAEFDFYGVVHAPGYVASGPQKNVYSFNVLASRIDENGNVIKASADLPLISDTYRVYQDGYWYFLPERHVVDSGVPSDKPILVVNPQKKCEKLYVDSVGKMLTEKSKLQVPSASYYPYNKMGKSVAVEDLHLDWIQSTASVGYFYDKKTLKVDKVKKTVTADLYYWEPSIDAYTICGGCKFDYINRFSKMTWLKIVCISNGTTSEYLNSKTAKFGDEPFNSDIDNIVFEEYFQQFIK